MSYSVVLGDVFQTSFFCGIPGQESVTNHWGEITQLAVGGVTDQQICTQLDATFGPLFKGLIGNTAEYHGTTLRQRPQPAPRPVTKFASVNAGIGTGGANLMPTQAAGLISWGTDFMGKSQRGRTYMPFPSEEANEDPGRPTAGYIVLLQGYITAILATVSTTSGLSTAIMTFGAWSPIIPTVHVTPWIDGLAHVAWATQMRRGAFGRLNRNPF